MTAEHRYDLIIVGAGPIGLAVAIEAGRAGLDALLIDKGMLVNTLYRFPTNMTFFSTSVLLEIGDVPFVSHGDKPTRREALEYYRRVFFTHGLQARLYETVTNVIPAGGGFSVETDKGRYACKNVAIATGFYDYPVLMDVPGEDLPKVRHFYEEAHPYVGQRVVVVGAANSACDVALELWHKGAEVTMVVREDRISDRVKYWIRPNIENRIQEGSIRAFFRSNIIRITEHLVEIDTPDGQVIVPNDFVLAMTGYRPDFDFLARCGVQTTDDPRPELAYDPDTHETSVPGLYVAGVVCGGMRTNKFFIENAREHAEKIVRNLAGAM